MWQLSLRGRWWKRAFGRYLFRDANIWLSFGCPAPATRNCSHKWNMSVSHGSYKPVDRVIFDMDGLLLGPETHFYLLLVMLCFKCWNPFIHSSRVRVWWRPGPPQPVEKHYWHGVSCKVFTYMWCWIRHKSKPPVCAINLFTIKQTSLYTSVSKLVLPLNADSVTKLLIPGKWFTCRSWYRRLACFKWVLMNVKHW